MKIHYTLSFLLFMSIVNFGCKKSKDIDEYYVKYEVNSTTVYYGVKLNTTISNEKNSNTTLSIDAKIPWEKVVGPVKKGFNASLSVVKEGAATNQLRLSTQISISKNNGPFALKKIDDSNTPRNTAQLSYTIDF